MIAYILVALCILLGTTAQICLKNGMNQVGKIESIQSLFNPATVIHMFSNPYVFVGFCLYAVSSVMWLGALSQLAVSSAYPLISIGYVLTAIGGVLLLGESMPLTHVAGVLTIVCGVFLISR